MLIFGSNENLIKMIARACIHNKIFIWTENKHFEKKLKFAQNKWARLTTMIIGHVFLISLNKGKTYLEENMKISLISNGSIFVFCLGWPKTFFSAVRSEKRPSSIFKAVFKIPHMGN